VSHLIFIRHAETVPLAGVSAHEWRLSDRGRAACGLLAERLRPCNIERMYSSDEPKAVETAALLADHLGLAAPALDPALRETARETAPFYDSVADFHAAIARAMTEPDDLLFGEETFTDARERFAQRVTGIAERGRAAALVTHGTILALYIAHSASLDSYALWRSLKMPAYIVLKLPDLSLVEIVPGIAED
jgi:broad specificity phosphatase PhoE